MSIKTYFCVHASDPHCSLLPHHKLRWISAKLEGSDDWALLALHDCAFQQVLKIAFQVDE